jgi:site-specific recombinase XerD
LLALFINGRRQGLTPNTIKFYKDVLRPFISRFPLTSDGINSYLTSLTCKTITKDSYFKGIRAFINWCVRNEYLHDNPLLKVDPPKPEKRVLPSLTQDQVDYLIEYVDDVREKAIISLLADSGMRVSELASVTMDNIDWDNHTILIWGKGTKQRKAPFTDRSVKYLREYIEYNHNGNGSSSIWDISRRRIQFVLW